MATGDDSLRSCIELVAGLADAGVRWVFVSPGSRNTPLTIAASLEPRVATIVVRDERSAGFMALGIGKATGTPAAVVCTSGSAAAHYLPAVVEADQSAAPLVVLTSDRPVRLRGTAAPQTMDQVDLYGTHVKAFHDLPEPSGGPSSRSSRTPAGASPATPGADPRSTGVELVVTAMASVPGAVHANLPFDEPLVPTSVPGKAEPRAATVPPPTGYVGSDILRRLAGKRTMIVASGRQHPGFAAALDAMARRLGAPILADPQTVVTGNNVLQRPDLLIPAHDDAGRLLVLDRLAPDVVIRLGPLPTAKPLWQWLETSGVEQIHVEESRLADPLTARTTRIHADPKAFLMGEPAPEGDQAYVERWRALDTVASDALAEVMAAMAFPNEPEVARSTADLAPPATALVLASSRPIRDVDAFAARRDDRPVFANRGVNGIDGTISTAVGVALAHGPTTLLIGDVAFLHDATAVSEAVALGVPLRIVVVNNDGGGIFEFLPQARSEMIGRERFERLWATPHGLGAAPIARSMGMVAAEVFEREVFRAAVSAPVVEPELIEVRTDRGSLVADHDHIRHAVAAALAAALASGGGDDVEERA